MKRWTGSWQRAPRLRVTPVRPGRETNTLAEKVMEALRRALETAQHATDNPRTSTEALRNTLAPVNKLQAELASALEE